ncbi:alpha/beta fold hydrolase [Nocardia sp. NPDC056100]|uniref:alpha/beta fold hydrolase n=1 Tax=Nocardia sp. NPDC056100 TaxID=3345712 RepID=UPI0035DCDA97
MTEYVDLGYGTLACDVVGEGPLVVLSHGMGTVRQDFRHLVGVVAGAGYRVVNVDMRGHGESSVDWPSVTGEAAISRADVAGDLLGVIRHFGGPAVIVGHSLSGGSATIAAAREPGLVSGIVEIGPFTLTQDFHVGAMVTSRRYRRGMVRLGLTSMLKSLTWWRRYLDLAYPTKPADYEGYLADLEGVLRRPERWEEFAKTGRTTPADAHARLADVRCPALVIVGAADPDFADPEAEANAIVAAMPEGVGRVVMVENGGHYPHAQFPDRVAAVLLPFLERYATPARDAGFDRVG